ncbi:hypothetical protein C0995_013561 [Termitomyces sp. Mi166|nr:hypothetical protein C0995_013561 [Termitomyces sp. Mi166\
MLKEKIRDLEQKLEKEHNQGMTEADKALTKFRGEIESLKTKQNMWIKEKDGLKNKIRTVELVVEDKQRELEKIRVLAKEAESKRQKAEKNTDNMERKMKDAEEAAEEARRRLNEIILRRKGDAETTNTKNSGVPHGIVDAGSPSTAHRGRLQWRGHSLSGTNNQKQTEFYRNQSKSVESLEKQNKILQARIDKRSKHGTNRGS